LLSTLPAFDTEYTGAWIKAGVDTALLGLELSGGLVHRDALQAQALGFPVSSDRGYGYFLGLDLPLKLGSWSLVPSVLFAQGFWEEGDLYWFFGEPQVPALVAPGLSLSFREEQGLYFRYLSLDLRILSPWDETLLSGHVNGFTGAYRWTRTGRPFGLDAAAGWLSLAGNMQGSLNAENQPYLLFPYAFYDAALDTRVHGLFAVLNGEYRRGFFRLTMSLGAAQVLFGSLNLDRHSKQKTLSYLGVLLFDGREEYGSWSSNPGGLGGAFFLIKGGLEALPLGRNRKGPRLSLTGGKLFALPWGYEPLVNAAFSELGEGGAAGPQAAGGGPSLTSILLSGLSFCCSITW
jgi:hypothetical protein